MNLYISVHTPGMYCTYIVEKKHLLFVTCKYLHWLLSLFTLEAGVHIMVWLTLSQSASLHVCTTRHHWEDWDKPTGSARAHKLTNQSGVATLPPTPLTNSNSISTQTSLTLLAGHNFSLKLLFDVWAVIKYFPVGVSEPLVPTVAVLGAKCYFRLRVSSEGRRGGVGCGGRDCR